jgi:hypothetical protein
MRGRAGMLLAPQPATINASACTANGPEGAVRYASPTNLRLAIEFVLNCLYNAIALRAASVSVFIWGLVPAFAFVTKCSMSAAVWGSVYLQKEEVHIRTVVSMTGE